MALLLFLFALPAPSGWKAGDLEIYDTRTAIYAAINGAADLYFAYGLEQMQVREYSRGKLAVEVELYELGEPLDAFGVLHRERPPNSEPVAVGAEAVTNPQVCAARHGRFYLRAKAFRGDLTPAACESLLGPIVATLESSAEPTELALLPSAGRVALGYTRDRFLGLSALVRCVHADYRVGRDTYRAFVMVGGDWDALASSFQPVPEQSRPTLRREVPYTGWVALTKAHGRIVGAVAADEEAALARLERVVATTPKAN